MSYPRWLVLLTALSLAGAACGAGASSKPTPIAVERPTPADAGAIRDVDFASVSAFQTLLRQLTGEYDRRAVLYADLTGDGRDEAIVPVASGGTLGNLGYQVFTLRAGVPTAILTSARDQTSPGGMIMTVEDGRLVRTVGRYGPEDPRCCPSVLVKTYYRWDGTNLQVAKEEEIKATPGPKQ